ncbi:MAG: MMPL family transporter [Saprospiraceae bacterium]|nr:MMPL family transporter [Saprospiraceae bacterium]
MIQKLLTHRKYLFVVFGLLCLFSIFGLTRLRINFEFEQFFPDGDEDLSFFKSFTSEFENDDNFLFISLKNKTTVFDTAYLQKLHKLTLEVRDLPGVVTSQSITSTRYPVKTPFGYSLLPLVHKNDAIQLKADSAMLANDERVKGYFVSKDMSSAAIVIKTQNKINVVQSDSLLNALKVVITNNGLEWKDVHLLGRSFFQSELVALQKREVMISTLISAILVSVILWLIFASWWSVLITIIGVTASLLIFMGLLAGIGRELTLMSALYPVLILIVGSSDVIHLMSKYIDSTKENDDRIASMVRVIKEIGFATFLTSATTAVGFATLVTSRLNVIREFGINAGIGVMIAFVVVLLVVPGLLVQFKPSQLYRPKGKAVWLQHFADFAYQYVLKNPRRTAALFIVSSLICMYGISKITTNYKLIDNLPRGAKVTEDFLFFEKNYAGFRPLEFAITVKPPYQADDYKVVSEIDKLENYLRSTGTVKSSLSLAMIYKSMHMMANGNQKAFYSIPEDSMVFNDYRSLLSRMKNAEATVLMNKNKDKTRVSTIIADIGADSIKIIGKQTDQWLKENVDTTVMEVRRTGTGLILDKNSVYVTESLLKGLLLSVVLISLLMAWLLKNWRMWLISMVPNLFPLLFAAALLGFFNIELEAGISIIFAVIFGIAVDDTIHFLTRFKLCIGEGLGVEESLAATFKDTGKALVLTTVILFFGFLVMLFSSHPPSLIVGVLVSITLVSALICDLFLLPLLIRYWYK